MKGKTGRYEHFFSLSLDMLCIAGFDGYFRELNPAWETTLGFSRKHLLSKPWLDFVHPQDRESTIAAGANLSGGGKVVAFENRYICKNGRYKWLLWNAQPIPGEKLIYAVARDITGRKGSEAKLKKSHDELQAQLLQAQKMEAIGRLAGGVAHDFNNLLTAIAGGCHFLINSFPPEDVRRADVMEIQNAAERASALTRQLLAFSRQQVLQLRVLDLGRIVLDIQGMLRRLIGEEFDLATVLHKDLGGVKADPGQIEQVILNLVVNARDAMPKGGKITIETENVELGRDYARANPGVKPGRYVMLAVSDTGCGMNAKTLSRIFEPFFTTKPQGKGSGLGLSTVYGIVKQSGGSVFVYSEPGKGSSFKVYLPRTSKTGRPAAAGSSPARSRRGSETILLVEDDAMVRNFVKRLLLGNGYRLLETRSSEEALSLCQRQAEPIHLLLTDIVMPGLRGDELAKRLLRARPELKVIYMSGYTETGTGLRAVRGAHAAFLQKPLAAGALLGAIRESLDGPPATAS